MFGSYYSTVPYGSDDGSDDGSGDGSDHGWFGSWFGSVVRMLMNMSEEIEPCTVLVLPAYRNYRYCTCSTEYTTVVRPVSYGRRTVHVGRKLPTGTLEYCTGTCTEYIQTCTCTTTRYRYSSCTRTPTVVLLVS